MSQTIYLAEGATQVDIYRALAALPSGGTVVLPENANITITQTLYVDVSNRDITIDLNGSTLQQGANTPIVWATLHDASHLVPMRGGGVYPGIITAWFRYQLMGDAKAAAMFTGPQCGYCTNSDWTIQRKGGV